MIDIIICTTSAKTASSIQIPLAASLSKYVETRCSCVVVYVDCVFILQAPKQDRVTALASDLRTGVNVDNDRDDLSDKVLESLYCQLFRLCDRREQILKEYNNCLSPEQASQFRTHIIANGVPRKQDLLQLLSRFHTASSSPILISIDRINVLDDSSRSKLMSNLMALNTHKRGSLKSLLCGNESLPLTGNHMINSSIISDNTEIQGWCEFYLAFDYKDYGTTIRDVIKVANLFRMPCLFVV